MTQTRDVIQKLWGLCNVLRDDGITYHEYVTELTILLFLKMMEETGEEKRIPGRWRWSELTKLKGSDQLDHYRQALASLGKEDSTKTGGHADKLIYEIFRDARTRIRRPASLQSIVDGINEVDWFAARESGFGDIYEGILERNATDKKSGSGQYFTPRPLIECLVRLNKPQLGEIVQDPAAGTAGFLVAANRYVSDLIDPSDASKQDSDRIIVSGMELVPDTHRLAIMNLALHRIRGDISCGDALAAEGAELPPADLILTNPPFGNKRGGGRPTRRDLALTSKTSNKQLAFIEHIVISLKDGGRAAVIIPDNVLFEDGIAKGLRTWLMERCNLHTVLRLPTGIFYAQGVQTNVLFFTKGSATEKIWFYDMRSGTQGFGKSRPMTDASFRSFEIAYGTDPTGQANRHSSDVGRFRSFLRAEIAERNDDLNISWSLEKASLIDNEPEDASAIISLIVQQMNEAIRSLSKLSDNLNDRHQ